MSWREIILDALPAALVALVAGVASTVLYLVRKIHTNERQIDILVTTLKDRDEERDKDRVLDRKILDEFKADFHRHRAEVTTDSRDIRAKLDRLIERL